MGKIRSFNVELDFDHAFFYAVDGLAEMLIDAHRARAGNNPGLIAVVAEEETLEDVTENRNLAQRLGSLHRIGFHTEPHFEHIHQFLMLPHGTKHGDQDGSNALAQVFVRLGDLTCANDLDF